MTLRSAMMVCLLCALPLAGCSGLTGKQQRALSGGAIGAGVGAVGSAIVGGSVLTGAAIGAAGGAVIGVLAPHK